MVVLKLELPNVLVSNNLLEQSRVTPDDRTRMCGLGRLARGERRDLHILTKCQGESHATNDRTWMSGLAAARQDGEASRDERLDRRKITH
jgi:hypothetical protein